MANENTNKQFRVAVIESERGWGRKIDHFEYFDTLREANNFVREYNSYNTSSFAPDWYMQAETPEANPNYR